MRSFLFLIKKLENVHRQTQRNVRINKNYRYSIYTYDDLFFNMLKTVKNSQV